MNHQLRAVPEPPGVSFDALYEREFDYVWNALRRLGVREKDLEDVAHDVFVTAYRRLDSYDATRPARPWLFGIAFRVVSDFRNRAQQLREVIEEAPDVASEAPAADEAMALRQRRELVMAALEVLPLDQRAVFVMHELDGNAIPHVAEGLGIPLNTAYSRLRLARARFTAEVRRLRQLRGET